MASRAVLVAVAAAFLGMAGCSGSDAPTATDPAATVASDTASAPTSAPPAPTTTPPPSSTTTTLLPFPTAVEWSEVALDTSGVRGFATTVAHTSAGFVVLGILEQDQGGRPAIWRSADGASFALADTAALSPPGSRVTLTAAAGAVDGQASVAVGTRGVSCSRGVEPSLGSSCHARAGVAWFSPDGVAWQVANDLDGSFTDGEIVDLRAVTAFDGGFVATGTVVLSRLDWRIGVWTSPDGSGWTRTALLADPDGLLNNRSLAAAGGSILLTASVARCVEDVADTPVGYGYSLAAETGRMFHSNDGATWVPVDLVAEGLAEDRGPEICELNANSTGFVPGGPAPGTLIDTGGSMVWLSGGTAQRTFDGAEWQEVNDMSTTLLFGLTSGRAAFVDLRGSELLGITSGSVENGRRALELYRYDGERWASAVISAGVAAEAMQLAGGSVGDGVAVVVGSLIDVAAADYRPIGFVARLDAG